MDTLHTVLRAIRPERKSAPDHLTVFREFLAHLDKIQHKAPARPASSKLPRARPARRKTPKRGKGT
jgi:nitrate reductase assembly molybdenum cofactor insertion protein NarJ